MSAELPLELAEYLKTEPNYLPWAVFINRIRYYIDLLDLTEINGDLSDYLRELVIPMYKRLGWEAKRTDSWTDGLIRPYILKFACELEHPACVAKANEYFREWKNEDKYDRLLYRLVKFDKIP